MEAALEGGGDAQGRHEAAVRDKVLRSNQPPINPHKGVIRIIVSFA